jgi:uncharacterized caspase-like protein
MSVHGRSSRPRDGVRRALLLTCVCAFAPAGSALAGESTRSALLIGNSRYRGNTLRNPVNDARLMQKALTEVGFTVAIVLDASQSQMLDAIQSWQSSSRDSNIRLMYFAGHGAQYRGRNFMIPVDAQLPSEDDIPGRAVNINDLVDSLSRQPQGVSLVVVDACRSVPATVLHRQPPPPCGLCSMASQDGLSQVIAPRGTLVAHSTAPGAVAGDGIQAKNSVYTRHLAMHLRIPDLTIEAVFKRTREAVVAETKGMQVPWESSSLIGDFCIVSRTMTECGSRSAPTLAPWKWSDPIFR